VNDHFDVVQYLVEIGANENMNSESLGSSPLTTESEEGFYDIVQLRVQNGAAIDEQHQFYYTILQSVTEMYHT
jgi:ankyrin repeat protein